VKLLKEIFGRIWALWGLTSFIITFLIFFIPSMLTWLMPEPKGQAIFIGLARIWMNIWLHLAGCPVTIKGKEHFKKGKFYVVTFNHSSLMDIPLSCPYVPGANKTIAKASFKKIPLFGFYYMKGSVLVDRKSDQSRRISFEKMKAVLQNNMHMCIYPEGTRNRTAEPLKKFHDGAFRLACETGHDIIPALIFHTKKVLPPGKLFYFFPHRLEMHFLAPVKTSDAKGHNDLKEKVYSSMVDHYTQHLHQSP
jgi:1-acyl-sn-glycerol-3-phosphate acyltransferase